MSDDRERSGDDPGLTESLVARSRKGTRRGKRRSLRVPVDEVPRPSATGPVEAAGSGSEATWAEIEIVDELPAEPTSPGARIEASPLDVGVEVEEIPEPELDEVPLDELPAEPTQVGPAEALPAEPTQVGPAEALDGPTTLPDSAPPAAAKQQPSKPEGTVSAPAFIAPANASVRVTRIVALGASPGPGASAVTAREPAPAAFAAGPSPDSTADGSASLAGDPDLVSSRDSEPILEFDLQLGDEARAVASPPDAALEVAPPTASEPGVDVAEELEAEPVLRPPPPPRETLPRDAPVTAPSEPQVVPPIEPVRGGPQTGPNQEALFDGSQKDSSLDLLVSEPVLTIEEIPPDEVLTSDDLNVEAAPAEPPKQRPSVPPPPAPAKSAKAAGAPPKPPAAPTSMPPASPSEAEKGGAPAGPEPHRTSNKKKPQWWEEFFDDDYLRTVPPPNPRQIVRQCDFIEARLKLKQGATILDVGCGLGLHAVELTRRGYLLVGLDLSLPMLSRAADEAQDQGFHIHFLHADMRKMAFEGSFDAVLCIGTTFGYFDDEQNNQLLDRFHRALKPTGLLLLEVVNRDFVFRNQPNMVWFEGDGCVVMEETHANYFTSRLHVKRTVMLDDGRQRETQYTIRLYSLHELGQILHLHGFRVLEVSGHEATPGVFFGADSPKLILVAERRAQPAPPPPERKTVDHGPERGPTPEPAGGGSSATPPPSNGSAGPHHAAQR